MGSIQGGFHVGTPIRTHASVFAVGRRVRRAPQLAGGADTAGPADPISLLQRQCPMTPPAPS
jgi:hypothetical protein